MIDTTTESLLTFAEATRVIPGRPHLSQVYRWAMRGLRGVKLEWVQCGGKRFTSREAISRFIDALTRAAGGTGTAQATPRARQRQIARAERELVADGFEVGAAGLAAAGA